MIIYVESLIVNNFCITYFISDLTYVLTQCRKSRKRMLIVALISTFFAFLYLLTLNIIWLAYLIKLLALIVCSLILFFKKQKFISSTLIYIFSTIIVGGAITFIFSLCCLQPTTDLNSISFPFGLIVLCGYIITFLTKRLHNALNKGRVENNLIYMVKTSINGVALELKGFLDTGNRLIDDNSSLPVVIVKFSAIIKTFSPSTFATLIEKGKANYISYATVTGGISKIMIIYPDFFKIVGEKENKDVAIGVSFSGFYGDYDAILHPLIISK